MIVAVVLMISLAAVLQPSAGQHPDFAALSARHANQQEAIVQTHNDFRRNVKPEASNMLKMSWDPAAAETARLWAQECTLKHSTVSRRTINGRRCGENLFMSSVPTKWPDVIQSWHSEVKYFRHGHGSTTGDAVGHYTQVVWYRSYLVGCAVAYCPRAEYKYYSVCHYCPAGNVGSLSTPYKLGRPCGDCPNNCDNRLCTNPCKQDNVYSNCRNLAQSPGCTHTMVKGECKASCQCPTEIY